MEIKNKVMRRQKKDFQKNLFIIAMLLLPILNWAVFWLAVNIQSIALAFQDTRTGEFTFGNFKDVWLSFTTPGGDLGIALKNTAIYFTTHLFIVIPISIIIAFFIYKKIFMHRLFKVVFYFPAIISGVVLVKVYLEILNPNGAFSQLFGWLIHIPPEGLMSTSATATLTIVIYTIWTGFSTNILLFLGAMTRIPVELLESAKLDGCKPFTEIVKIIIPLVWPTIASVFILSFTTLFSSSGPILLFSPNGDYNTVTLSFWIFKQVYGTGEVGGTGSYNLVSATGLCLTLIGVPIILFARRLIEKVPDVEY